MASQEQISRAINIGIVANESDAVRAFKQLEKAISTTKDRTGELSQAAKILSDMHAQGKIATDAHTLAQAQLDLAFKRQTDRIDALIKKHKELKLAQEKAASAAAASANDTLGLGAYGGSGGGGRQGGYSGIDPATGQPVRGPVKHDGGMGLSSYVGGTYGGGGPTRSVNPVTGVVQFEYDGGAADAHVAAMRARKVEIRQSGMEYMRQFETDTEAQRRRLSEVSALQKQGALTSYEYSRAMKSINTEYATSTKILNQAKGVVGTLFGPLSMTVAAGALAYKTYAVNAEYEQSLAKMTALTGSRGQAMGVAASMRNLTASAPVSFGAAMKAASTYMQYGGEAQLAPGVVKSFAAITGGDSDAMDRMALAFSQTQATGKLMAQELNQMINSGFNPLMIISERTGESIAKLRKRMEDGGISAKEIAEAFKAATAEGGKFGNMLNEMANTMPGKVRRLNAEMERAMIGDGNRGGVGGWLAHSGYSVVKGINMATGQEDERSFLQRKGDLYDQIGTTGDSKLDAALSHRRNLNHLLEADPATLSASEQQLVKLYRGAESQNKERMWTQMNITNPDDILARLGRHDKVKAGGDEEATARDYIAMVNELGGGHFSKLADRNQFADAQKLLETRATERADKDRITRMFQTSIDKAKSRNVDKEYGVYGDAVNMTREQSTGDERAKIDGLIAERASWEKIRDAANPTAQGLFNTLAEESKRKAAFEQMIETEEKMRKAIADKNAEKGRQREKFFEDVRDMETEIRYKQELITLGKEEADILKYMRDYKVDRRLGEHMANRQRRMDMLNEDLSTTAITPRAMQAGSQEAFAAMAKAQSMQMAEEIRLAREANRLLEMANGHLEGMGTI